MAGYAVTARLGRIEPHLSPALAGAPRPSAPGHEDEAPLDTAVPATFELDGHPFGEAFADWLGGLNRACSQTFFYVFDPNSWR